MDPLRVKERGFTLIEVMISLTLTLIVLVTVYASMMADGSAYEANRATHQLVRKSRMSLYTMRLYIQQAGYREFDQLMNNQKPGPGTSTIGGYTWTWQDGQIIQALDNQSSYPNARSGTDVLALRFYGSDAANGEVYRCNGDTLAENTLSTLVFYLSEDDELICVDENGATVFETGIEQLQMDFAANDNADNKYLAAGEVTDWNTMSRVRLAALVAQDVARSPLTSSKTYTVLDQTVTSSNDSRIRQVIHDTIFVYNNRG